MSTVPNDTGGAAPDPREIASARRDIDLFGSRYGWIRENPDQVLRNVSGGRGIRAYEDLERDDQVFAEFQKRRLAVVACEWVVDPASDRRSDRRIAEFVREVLQEANFDKACFDLLQGILTGYKLSEILWKVSSGEVRIREIRGRQPHRFTFDWEDRPRLLTPENMVDGEPLPDRKFLHFTYGGSNHNPFGQGLGRILWWWVWFKKNAVKFWLLFCEKFGSPTAIGRYPIGATQAEQDKLLDVIRSIQQDTGLIIPEGMAIELLQAKGDGKAQGSYHEFCTYCDRAISKVILGQTLTSEPGDSGSYSLGRVHEGIRQDILKADADLLSETINRQLVRWIVDFNFGPQQAYPTVWRRTEPEQDLKDLAERDRILLRDIGMARFVPRSYISETYGLPLAGEGDEVIGERGQGEAGEPPSGAYAQAQPDPGQEGQNDLDRVGDRIVPEGEKRLEALMSPVFQWIDEGGDLEEMGRKIAEWYPKLDSGRFQELLHRALFYARLRGAASVMDEGAR